MKEIIDLIDALELECKSEWKNEDCIIGVEQFAKVLKHRVGLVKKDLIAIVGETCCDKPKPDLSSPMPQQRWCENCHRKI
jgi:hypothetical protein